ncbi:hypothetical protein BOX15_Mlig019318g1 [Macrostomum lignano]|uniref:Cyclic nucleotide-binding domain-containing protein n=1 Tax=Macrostomum lignano TaxID=282301 RepID=A0A267ESA2_9PLAT|nr:hypothetical protein BOX15_Mlig019318g1 [Macrostomum lignano]
MDSAGDEHGPGASADEVTAMSVFDETTVDAAKNSEEAVLEPQTAPDDADMDVEPADDELEAEKEQHDTDEAANATAATDESLGDQLIEQTDQQPSPPATETETPEDHVESAVAAEEVTKQPFSTQQPPEDSSDEDEDEEDDVPGELPTIATQQSSASKLTAGAASPDSATNDEDDDDTKSDASEPVDEEDEETNRSESPTSAEARERRLKHRLTSFDKRQEKFSQMKAAVKTYDVNMEMVIGKWKRLREDFIKLRANSVLASGDDGSLMITRRMTEIGNMCSRTTNADYYIATLPESVQQIVKKMAAMPRDVFLEARRRDWTSYDWFMYAGRMARVLAQGCLVRRRLTIDALSNGRSLSEKDLLTNSVSKTLRDCLCFCPEYRTKEMRQKILWFLRTNKVYTHLFSSEMEEECTKYVFYEKYQDGRILSLVDRVPEKFYYVISGKIERRKTYELRSGDYDRVFSVITKGQTSDVELMELQRPKKFTLVTSGVTEVLSLEREDFLLLLKGTGGLPLNFLKNIGIFQEFPCGKFLESPEAIATRYFPKDRVILDDITDTPYIHVIKSGSAKVIRKQLVVHYPRNKYSRDRVIGYSKLGSHSTDMQGLTQRQRQFKAEQQPPELELPRLQGSGNPLAHTIGLVQREQQKSLSRGSNEEDAEKRRQQQQQRLPKLQTAAMPSATSALSNETSTAAPGDGAKLRRSRPMNMTARELKIPLRSAGSIRTGPASVETAVRPQSRRRAAAAARVLLGPEGFPPERPQREAYVVLDTLRNGDFLGFKNITTLIEGKRIVRDKKNVLSLLSDGAEIILINKRFFVQNAANNTLLKAETMARDFASKSEASESIEAKEDWEMFRAAFVQRMAAKNRQARQERQARILSTQN